MISLQKAGGMAALFEAFAYIIGFVVIATLLDPGNTDGWDTARKLSFVLEQKTFFQAWTLLIYVGFGVALVVLAVALHERLKEGAEDLMKVATPFGLIWAGLVIASGMVASVGLESVAAMHSEDVVQATSTWVAINAVQNGLGGGVEIVGGVWVLLISVAAMRSAALPRLLGWLGIVVGVAGILTIIPALEGAEVIFGLSQIPWFAWIGVLMLSESRA